VSSLKALLENRKTGVDHKLIQAAIRTLSIAVRDVMKPDADITARRSEVKMRTPPPASPTNAKLARIFNRHDLLKKKAAVDVTNG
jgi:hypothetical protein